MKISRDYNDRYQATSGEMGGLPDVNTENPDFQKYYLQYVNDLINLGSRGFRYDTAKHIALPGEPKDAKSERNNFWDVATGREGVKGLTLLMPDSLYIYGEVLQDKNVNEKGYAEYIDQTASGYGHILREALEKGDANAVDLSRPMPRQQWTGPAPIPSCLPAAMGVLLLMTVPPAAKLSLLYTTIWANPLKPLRPPGMAKFW